MAAAASSEIYTTSIVMYCIVIMQCHEQEREREGERERAVVWCVLPDILWWYMTVSTVQHYRNTLLHYHTVIVH